MHARLSKFTIGLAISLSAAEGGRRGLSPGKPNRLGKCRVGERSRNVTLGAPDGQLFSAGLRVQSANRTVADDGSTTPASCMEPPCSMAASGLRTVQPPATKLACRPS